MKAFLVVNLFLVVFAAVIGGALFLCGALIQSLHLSNDAEHVAWAIAAVVSLIGGGLLMKQLHAMIQRRM